MQDLQWHRNPRTGAHSTDVTGNVEFTATVTRNAVGGGWYLYTPHLRPGPDRHGAPHAR